MRALALLLALGCAACVPWPHTVLTRPAVAGQVVSAGAPVAGVQLFAGYGGPEEPCATTVPLATSDAGGRFSAERQHRWRYTYAPLVAPIATGGMRLCIATGAAAPVFAGEYLFQTYEREKGLTLACDLAAPREFSGLFDQRRRAWFCPPQQPQP
ncbi:MAG TPA: hypothetical protein VLI06_08640 [Solimonas sp.]|nr:hypothetical protein [Solimonas sp.]